jgi:5-methylcytosine-specific restriction endonuclease McrA
MRRARSRCEYCRMRGWPLTVDHVIPRAAWLQPLPPDFPPDDPDNLAVACYECNIVGKRARTRGVDPLSGAEVDLFHPRRQRWRDHFAWSADFFILKGKTPTGWATIEVLRLNGPRYRAQRRLLRLAMEAGSGSWP